MSQPSAQKQELIDTDEDFRHLYEQHQAYKRQLADIRQKSLHSQEDEIEMKRIKLRKLELKDRMEFLMHEHRQTVPQAAAPA